MREGKAGDEADEVREESAVSEGEKKEKDREGRRVTKIYVDTYCHVKYAARIWPVNLGRMVGLVRGTPQRKESSIGPHGQASASCQSRAHQQHRRNSVTPYPMTPCTSYTTLNSAQSAHSSSVAMNSFARHVR